MGFNVDVVNYGVECLDKLRKMDWFVFLGSDEGESSSREKKFFLLVILMDIEMFV